jgi:hypothetical protein
MKRQQARDRVFTQHCRLDFKLSVGWDILSYLHLKGTKNSSYMPIQLESSVNNKELRIYLPSSKRNLREFCS